VSELVNKNKNDFEDKLLILTLPDNTEIKVYDAVKLEDNGNVFYLILTPLPGLMWWNVTINSYFEFHSLFTIESRVGAGVSLTIGESINNYMKIVDWNNNYKITHLGDYRNAQGIIDAFINAGYLI